MDKISEFKKLYNKFKNGMSWLNLRMFGYFNRDGSRVFYPEIERHIKDFEDRVVDPMDDLWKSMKENERLEALKK